MKKGYKVKVNGVYEDDNYRGWIGYEIIGITPTCPICVGGCDKHVNECGDGYLVSGLRFCCKECYTAVKVIDAQ